MKTSAKSGKKNRKYLRNKKWCERYRAENREEKNKKVKLLRHLRKHPVDLAAIKYCVDSRLISKEQIAAL